MRAFLVALVLLLGGCLGVASGPEPLEAPGRIDGAVVDRLLQPYGGLNVTLVQLGRTDVTSQLGGFTFRDVPPGVYTLEASHPGTLGDRRVVEVRPDRITRIILQLLPVPSVEPYVGSLAYKSHTDLALPGTECSSCQWETFPHNVPEEVVLHVEWDSLRLGSDRVQARLVDEEGRVLGEVEGGSPLELDLLRERLPAGLSRIRVQVAFPEGFTPQPFDMRSRLDLYYNAPRSGQGTGA